MIGWATVTLPRYHGNHPCCYRSCPHARTRLTRGGEESSTELTVLSSWKLLHAKHCICYESYTKFTFEVCYNVVEKPSLCHTSKEAMHSSDARVQMYLESFVNYQFIQFIIFCNERALVIELNKWLLFTLKCSLKIDS